jgi:hypothetical protein
MKANLVANSFKLERLDNFTYNSANRITMTLVHVFNFFNGFPHDNTSFWLIWIGVLLYQKPSVHAGFSLFFCIFLRQNLGYLIGAKL